MIFTAYSFKTLAAKIEHLGEDELLSHILVPVDFSECSDNAIRFAVAIAIRTGAEIRLFHGLQVPLQTAELSVFPLAEMEKEAATRLAHMAAEIEDWLDKEKFRPLRVKHRVTVGFPAEEVVRVAKEEKTDLIVMGTHGTGAIEGMILGSNASHVLQNSGCPVLVVPENAEFEGFRRIAYASDMKELNEKAISVLTHFASHFQSEIHVLHVLTGTDKLTPEQANAYRARFDAAAAYPRVSYHIVDAEDRSVPQAIEEYMDTNEVEVVATVTHHRSFFDKIFHPSLTKRLAVHARKPLLAFH
ncbi:MAG: universal stress protein [Bacteroidia bacterium]